MVIMIDGLDDFQQHVVAIANAKRLFNWWLLFLVCEFSRRVCQVGLDCFKTSKGWIRFLELLTGNLNDRFGFACLSVLPSTLTIYTFPSWLILPTTEGWLIIVVLTIVYFVIHYSGLHLSKVERRELSEKSAHNLGAGLALGFYSYLENTLQDPRTSESIEWFIETNIVPDGINNYSEVGSRTPLILFPDLAASFYRDDLDRPVGLVSGMVKRDDAANKSKEARVTTEDEAWYDYRDKAGLSRKSYYTVVSMKEGDQDNLAFSRNYYYFVCDNRPLLTLQKWLKDKVKPGDNMEEFQRQLSVYGSLARDLLVANEHLNGKYHILNFKGPLSEALGKFRQSEALRNRQGLASSTPR